MASLLPWLLLALAPLSLPEGAAPQGTLKVMEQASRESFPLERAFPGRPGQRLQAAGVYLRIRDGAKLYALCLYVDLKRMRALSEPGHRDREALAALLVEGKVAQGYVSRFVEPVAREARMAFLVSNLEAAWEGGAFDPTLPAFRSFQAFFDRPLRRGDETQVWIDDRGGITTLGAGSPRARISAPALARAWVKAYLGPRPMDAGMKEELVRELPEVLELEDLIVKPVKRQRK